MSVKIFGVDQGTYKMGWACLDFCRADVKIVSSGVLEAKKDLPPHQRLVTLWHGLKYWIDVLRPDVFAVEGGIVNPKQSGLTTVRMGEVKGIVMLLAGLAEKPVLEIAPSRVKKTVTGKGNATKEEVKFYMRAQFRFPEDVSLDESDAIAITFTAGVKELKMNELRKKANGKQNENRP
jgi:crossover junction endodeoxyribonuclease RuvC